MSAKNVRPLTLQERLLEAIYEDFTLCDIAWYTKDDEEEKTFHYAVGSRRFITGRIEPIAHFDGPAVSFTLKQDGEMLKTYIQNNMTQEELERENDGETLDFDDKREVFLMDELDSDAVLDSLNNAIDKSLEENGIYRVMENEAFNKFFISALR
jgi:hypothetical protein